MICLLAGAPLLAAEMRVSSVEAIKTAIALASPGDRIIVANGTYTTDGSIDIIRQGTETQPIVICAESVGGVEINGAAGFALRSPGAYVEISGFRFTHRAGTLHLAPGTHHCRLSHNVFELKIDGSAAYVTVSVTTTRSSATTLKTTTPRSRSAMATGKWPTGPG
jgi:poly(beta-D-mannuronate) lyase